MWNFFRRPTVRHSIAGSVGAILSAAAMFISPWEGYFGHTYKDIVGVDTVCYGETDKPAVEEGKRREFTKEECRQMLAKSLVKYDTGMKACLKKPITDNMHVAFLSATYNIGIAGFCKSSMARLVNDGKPRQACDALLAWNKAGGKVVKGLDNRRKAERSLCLQGI
jgi:lysozyme